MSQSSLSNRVLVITGGSTGIGFSTARAAVQRGAKVVITGRNAEALKAAGAELGSAARTVVSDASDSGQIKALFEDIARTEGRIDGLFLNAGIAEFAPLEAQSEEGLQRLFAVNVFGPYLAVQAALPLLGKGSSVLLNTSVVNNKGLAATSAYASTKAALRSFARTLATELAPRGIRINAVSPGPIETPIYSKLGMPEAELNAFAGSVVAGVPLQRFGRADELADGALFLLSDQASFITGAELAIDGGFGQV